MYTETLTFVLHNVRNCLRNCQKEPGWTFRGVHRLDSKRRKISFSVTYCTVHGARVSTERRVTIPRTLQSRQFSPKQASTFRFTLWLSVAKAGRGKISPTPSLPPSFLLLEWDSEVMPVIVFSCRSGCSPHNVSDPIEEGKKLGERTKRSQERYRQRFSGRRIRSCQHRRDHQRCGCLIQVLQYYHNRSKAPSWDVEAYQERWWRRVGMDSDWFRVWYFSCLALKVSSSKKMTFITTRSLSRAGILSSGFTISTRRMFVDFFNVKYIYIYMREKKLLPVGIASVDLESGFSLTWERLDDSHCKLCSVKI